jgi:hypothetical protein
MKIQDEDNNKLTEAIIEDGARELSHSARHIVDAVLINREQDAVVDTRTSAEIDEQERHETIETAKLAIAQLEDRTLRSISLEHDRNARRRAMIEAVSPDLALALDAFDQDFATAQSELNESIEKARERVKELTLKAQTTIKGQMMAATYIKASHSWDKDKIDGYAVAHKEIDVFRVEKSATVRIEARRDKKSSGQ